MSESSVRPWKPPSKAMTAGRSVKARENLTAFSTASVPALKNAALRGPGDRSELAEALGKRDVDLVGNDREVGVAETRQLLLRRLDQARVRVAHVEAADTTGEVDERVAVDIGERRSAALGGHDRQVDRERVGNDPLLALQDLPRAGPGDLRAELDRLRRRHGGGR